MRLFGLIAAVAMALGTVAAQAESVPSARLVDSHGKVLVNLGEGYGPAAPDMALAPGTRLHVGAESSALIAFAGCSVTLPELSAYVVPAGPPCSKGSAAMQGQSVIIEPASGSFTLGGVDGQAIAVTGAVVGIAGLVGILALNYDPPDDAASP